MKRFSVLSLVVGVAMVFSIAGFGCKKAEQPAEAPKSAEQVQAPVAAEGFKAFGGTVEKGGIGFVLTADKDKNAIAVKKTEKSFKNTVLIKGQMKSALGSGVRNGMIVFGENPSKTASASVLMGAGTVGIKGLFIDKVEKKYKLDPGKVFDIELTVNLKEAKVSLKVDGNELTAKMKGKPASINYIGYGAWSTKTEFSELQISGD